ncbi:hypothetical protein I6E29_08580 [Arcanobacterium haemolyticum]|nr:hypothetical protein [Arcanobacterium haemolyticum]
MYYEEGLRQQDIADQVGVSRVQISRILNQARADGIVKISIQYEGYFPEYESRLKERFPHVDFLVCDSLDGSDAAIKRSIGVTGADYLEHRAQDGMSIAVGWGTTLRELGSRHGFQKRKMTFVPIIGGQEGTGLDVHANSIAELLARHFGGTALKIFAPASAESIEAREHFVSSYAVKKTLECAASADALLFSLGTPFGETTTIDKIGYFSPTEVEQLRQDGAACDVISIVYFDANGHECGQELSRRTVSITPQQLFNIPIKMCLAGGEDKHEAIKVALRLGIVDVLVTDDLTAKYLLE